MTVSPFAPAAPAYVPVTAPDSQPDPQPDLWQALLGTPVGAACDGSWSVLDFVPGVAELRELGEALDWDRNSTSSKSRGFDTPAMRDSAVQAPGLSVIPTFWYEG